MSSPQKSLASRQPKISLRSRFFANVLESPSFLYKEAHIIKRVCHLLAVIVACVTPVQLCAAKNAADFLKSRERISISLELEFTRKNPSELQRVISFLDSEPNAFATGFLVGNGLVITAYHAVSGNLDVTKKMALGFGRRDQLDVKIYAHGCQARIVSVDQEADLALLKVCKSSDQPSTLSFQATVSKDERLFLIARPNGQKVVGQGTFFGSYALNGIEYWSGKIGARDGFSGSPVYNDQGQLIGVFSGYDWSQHLAVISPGARAKKLLEEFAATVKP